MFGVAAVLWMLPGALVLSSGPDDPLLRLVEARLEVSSNTASATMTIPVVIAVAIDLGVSPVPPALGASFGFMLPVSTPPNAIVFGSGLVPLRERVRAGAILVLCPLVF